MASEKMWFAYELDFARRWTPVAYHGDKPPKKLGTDVERSTLHEVPEDCIGADGEPLFGKLMERFQKPKERD